MRGSALFVVALLVGCAGPGGKWPDLARRAAERPVQAEALAPPSATAFDRQPAPAPAPAAAASAAHLTRLEAAMARDQTALEVALSRARGAAAGDAAWATAQLALSRFDATVAPLAQLREMLETSNDAGFADRADRLERTARATSDAARRALAR